MEGRTFSSARVQRARARYLALEPSPRITATAQASGA